jgi:hypothetical protein
MRVRPLLLSLALLASPAGATDLQFWVERLRSDDPLVRRDARTQLGNMGENALAGIAAALRSGEYRLYLGGLEALAGMPPATRCKLLADSPDIRAAVDQLSSNADQTVRDSAGRARANCPQ